MPLRKEERQDEETSGVSTKKDDPNVEQPSVILQDVIYEVNEADSQFGDDIFYDDFTPQKCIKMNYADEFDLFSHFFGSLRDSGRLRNVVKGIYELSVRTPRKLFESDISVGFASDPEFVPPNLTENDNDFFNISDKVSVKFKEETVRYAEAKSKINRGEIVCIEKAIILTCRPNTADDGYSVHRCYHCLRIIGFFVTCPYCDVAIFCSYACRDASWHEYHIWECYGIQRNFWSTSSVEYVALRMLLLGLKYEYDTGDEDFDKEYRRTPNAFNDVQNVYKYMNKLSFTFRNRDETELADILLTVSSILVYLVECTHFIACISKLPKFKDTKPYDIYMFIGGMLLRHFGQAQAHQVLTEQSVMVTALFYNRLDFESAGIFIAESVFERNCKPNALYCLRDNYVIIKATEQIGPGQKITINWHPNRRTCFCMQCLTVCQLNAFHCMECNGSVMPECEVEKFRFRTFDYDDLFYNLKLVKSRLQCKQCKMCYELEVFELLNKEGQTCLEDFKRTRNLEHLKAAMEHYKRAFQATHIYHTYLRIMLLEYYLSNSMINHAREIVDYMTKYLVVVELHYGKFSRSLLSGRCSMLLHTLEMYNGLPLPPMVHKLCRHLLQSVKSLADYHCLQFKYGVLEQIIRMNYKQFPV